MAEIIWENNGQGKFDFDYLLKLTNQDFCDDVAQSCGDYESVKTIKVVHRDLYTTVFVVKGHGLREHTYYKNSKTRTGTFINLADLTWALEVINNG